jgi:hypothetical protein
VIVIFVPVLFVHRVYLTYIRNNLFKKKLYFKLNTNEPNFKVAEWDHIVQFYLLDTADDTRNKHSRSFWDRVGYDHLVILLAVHR